MARPRQQFKKIHPPRIKIYEDTIEWFKIYSKNTGISMSELYQEALDQYKRKEISD